jgi:hypothetical protein
MKLTRNRVIGAALVVLVAVLGIGQHLLEKEAIAQTTGKVMVPKFEVDPFWPKPMPNNWVFGQTIGLGVDEKDQVWIIHRGNDPGNLDRTELAFPPPIAGRGARGAAPVTEQPELNANQPMKVAECCFPAPPVVAFSPAGDVVYSWGGPKLHPDWPDSNHGITVDYKGNVWIGGNGQPDSHIMKFTRDGKFVAMFGKKGARRDPNNPNQWCEAPTISRASAAWRRSSSTGRPTRPTSPTATSTSAWRDRHGQRQGEALLGRLWRKAGQRQPGRRITRRKGRRVSSARRFMRDGVEGRIRVCAAIVRTIACRSSPRTASS